MKVTVMITDDDPVALLLHKKMLEKSALSIDPLCFDSGRQMLEYLRDHQHDGSVYLILLDINMPDMTSWQVLDFISIQPYADRIHILIVSSSVDRADHQRAKGYKQVIAYLEKPVGIETITALKQTERFKELFKNHIINGGSSDNVNG